MPLGTEVGLGPGDIVLDADPAPPPCKGAQQPTRQCAAGGCGVNPTDNCHPSSFMYSFNTKTVMSMSEGATLHFVISVLLCYLCSR